MKIFGQVNLSIDGIHSLQNIFRQQDSFTMVDQTIDLLINAGVPTGINCVVGKRNFDGLEDIFKYANSKKINEVEFLRIKPSGRGKNLYLDEKTTHQQNIELIPKLTEYSETYKISAKIDCSFVPMYCYHNPPIDLLDSFATYGCEAGNILLGIRSNGEVSGCSFLPFSGLSVFDLEDNYSQKMYTAFGSLFNWTQNAPEPCKTCNYLQICKGGCHCVSEFVTGIMEAPDPDCPFVNEYNKKVKS
jgi:radical SAM protein with 4Fe4S-binding SPASM domain